MLGVAWDRASRAEVELLVGWLRSAANPQRRRRDAASAPAGSVNLRTGKASLGAGYAPSTINHALTVLSSFYDFHLHFGRGPLVNPVPADVQRRRLLAHRSPIDPTPQYRRAPLRQKTTERVVRSIPDEYVGRVGRADGQQPGPGAAGVLRVQRRPRSRVAWDARRARRLGQPAHHA
jgi:hypothetical protein